MLSGLDDGPTPDDAGTDDISTVAETLPSGARVIRRREGPVPINRGQGGPVRHQFVEAVQDAPHFGTPTYQMWSMPDQGQLVRRRRYGGLKPYIKAAYVAVEPIIASILRVPEGAKRNDYFFTVLERSWPGTNSGRRGWQMKTYMELAGQDQREAMRRTLAIIAVENLRDAGRLPRNPAALGSYNVKASRFTDATDPEKRRADFMAAFQRNMETGANDYVLKLAAERDLRNARAQNMIVFGINAQRAADARRDMMIYIAGGLAAVAAAWGYKKGKIDKKKAMLVGGGAGVMAAALPFALKAQRKAAYEAKKRAR